MVIKWLTKISPSRIIILSAITTITVGTILLLLPISRMGPIPLIDVFYTAVSAITATGLATVDILNFSPFGIVIIAFLMQIGALGVIVLTLLIAHLFFGPNRPTRNITAELLGIARKRDTRRMLVFVVMFTLAVELIGALLIFTRLRHGLSPGHALFRSIFLAISAFTNTGFTLQGKSIEMYNDSFVVMITIMILMLFGAIGFTTLKEGFRYLTSLTKKIHYRFSLSSRIIWKTTFLLIFCSFLLCLSLEYNHAFAKMDGIRSAANALFNIISSMGTGMQTVATGALRTSTLLLIMVIAYIGGSPGSAGSGIKTTTMALFFAALRSVIRGKDHVILRGHRIDIEQVTKAIAMIALSIPFIILISFLLLVTDPSFTLLDSVFETVSSFANMGISTGITPRLTTLGKILACITMLAGRVGLFTLIFALRPLKKN